jgi:hypothetical protein
MLCSLDVVVFYRFIRQIFIQIDGATDPVKELEGCGFNYYSCVASDDSDDAANEVVDAGAAIEDVAGKVSLHACNCASKF